MIALAAVATHAEYLARYRTFYIVTGAAVIAIAFSALAATLPYETIMPSTVTAADRPGLALGLVAVAVGLLLVAAWLASGVVTRPPARIE